MNFQNNITYLHLCENISDNSNIDNVTFAYVEETRYLVQRILVPIVVTIGLIGNAITITVLSSRRMKGSTNTYLTALAISDFMYLLLSFFLSLKHYTGFKQPNYHIYWICLPFAHWIIDTFSGTSVWLTVSFTLERYIAVCHPLHGRALCTESRARKVVIWVLVLNALATVTTPFEWDVCYNYSESSLALQNTKFGKNDLYKSIYYWFNALAVTYIPLVIVCTLNFLLINAVRRSGKQRYSLTQTQEEGGCISSRQKQENKITMALVSIVFLFIICQIPTTILMIVSIFDNSEAGSAVYNYKLALGNIFNFLMLIYAATNFLLYCVMSDKFRRTVMITFFPCLTSHHRTNTATSITTFSNFSASIRRSIKNPFRTSINVPNAVTPSSIEKNKVFCDNYQ